MNITEALSVLGPGTWIPLWEGIYVLFLGFGAATLLVACFMRNEPLVNFMLVIPTGVLHFSVLILAPNGLGAGYIGTAWFVFVMAMAATVVVLYQPPAPRGNLLY